MQSIFTKIKRKVKATFSRRKKSQKSAKIRLFSPLRKKKKGRTALFAYRNGIILLFLVLGFVFIVVWFFIGGYKFLTMDIKKAYRDEEVVENKEWKSEGRINILLIGLDRRGGEFGYADTLLIVVVDPGDQSIGMFNINVDTSVYLPSQGKYEKLRNLYSFGVIEADIPPIKLLANGVETLLSIKINRYIIIDEEGVMCLVDALNGVHVENFSTVEDKDLSVQGRRFLLREGAFRLGGGDFLSYVRADDDGVENKLRRQVIATEGLFKRLISYTAFIKLLGVLNVIEEYVYTDLSRSEIMYLAYEVARFREINSAFMTSSSLQATNMEGRMVNLPIFDKLDEDIQGVFVDSRIGKEQARVEIFNSTSIRGLAAFRARWLRNIGIDIIRVGDTAEIYEKTTIYVREADKYKHTINAIKKTFDEEIDVTHKMPDFVCTGDVVIVIGKNAEG